jgi:hypothetical protein
MQHQAINASAMHVSFPSDFTFEKKKSVRTIGGYVVVLLSRLRLARTVDTRYMVGAEIIFPVYYFIHGPIQSSVEGGSRLC